jgi:hypothetical protein
VVRTIAVRGDQQTKPFNAPFASRQRVPWALALPLVSLHLGTSPKPHQELRAESRNHALALRLHVRAGATGLRTALSSWYFSKTLDRNLVVGTHSGFAAGLRLAESGPSRQQHEIFLSRGVT